MSKDNLKKFIDALDGCAIEHDKDLTKYSTMRLISSGDLITVNEVSALKLLLPFLVKENYEYRLIGLGANQLLPRKSNLIYICLRLPFNKAELGLVKETYKFPASITLAALSSHAVKNGLSGWEVFTGIPATLGGAIFMNAGTNLGEIGPVVKEVRIIKKDGNEKTVIINSDSFGYRKNNFLEAGDVIIEAVLTHKGQSTEITEKIKNYLALRNRTQPLKESTCGCIFKNNHKEEQVCRAGMFIDILGLKGFTNKNMQISPKHANFMVNLGGADFGDVCETISFIKKELRLQYGVDFETEVKLT